MGLKDDLLARGGVRIAKHTIKAWDAEVHVRTVSLGDFNTFATMAGGKERSADNLTEAQLFFLSKSLCDENGTELFTVDELKGLTGAVLTEAFGIAQAHQSPANVKNG